MHDNMPIRFPRLDGLRFVAITFVLFEHFGFRGDLFSAGYYGVDLFFVISGFLITGILLRDPDAPLRKALLYFMGRRALRIFPPYYLLILILTVTGFYPAREYSLSLLTYTFNYAAHQVNNPIFYLWSLSVEEQFYLIWPFLLLVFRKKKFALMVLILTVVIMGYAQLLVNIIPSMSQYNYTGLFNRMGSLGLGGLGAVYVRWRPPPKGLFMNRLVEVSVFLALAASLTLHLEYSVVFMGICSLFLVIKAAHFKFQTLMIDRLLCHPAIIYIGTVSYGIYLFHVPLGHTLTEHFFDPLWMSIPFERFGALEVLRWHSWLIKLPLYGGLSIAIAAASHRWFETPILRMKDRLFPTPPKQPIISS